MNVLNSFHFQDSALVSALLSLSKNGILVLEYVQTPAPTFLIKQANEVVQQLVEGSTASLTGAYLEQLPAPFNSPYLLQQLQAIVTAPDATANFQLTNPITPTGLFPIYDCQLIRIDPQVLVLSIEVTNYSPDDIHFQEQILETLPTGLIIFQAVRDDTGAIADFQATYCNQIGATITRQNRADILTRPISKRYQDMQAYELYHQYANVVTTGNPHHQIQYLPNHDIWLDISVVKFADGLLVSFQDVSLGQKTASLLESILISSPAAIRYYESIRDESGQIIDFLSSTGNELATYSSLRPFQSTTGRRLLDLYPYLKENGLFQRYVTVVETGESDHFETAYYINQSTVWLDCTAVRHGAGFVLTTLNITDRKQAQLSQQRQADLLTGVLNSSPNSILVLEAIEDQQGNINDFRIALTNPATLHMLPVLLSKNLTHEDLISHTIREFLPILPASRKPEPFTILVDVVKTRQPIRRQVDYPDRGISYEYEITPFQNGVLLVTTDITTLRAYQKKLEENNAVLSRSNEHLQQFAYIASHDLQEPLRKIQSFGNLLQSQYAAQLGDGSTYLERMQVAASRMSTLIRDLLLFSRLTTKPDTLAPVSLNQVIIATLTDLELVIQETGAVVDVQSLPTILGDRTQLEQLFQNLLSNALKFRRTDLSGTPATPLIQIRSQVIAATALPPSVQPTELAVAYHRVDVSDNGIGFDDKYVDRIFQVFQRLHGRNEFDGTGIGLAICEKVIVNHGGAITASSKPGQGATFHVYLPTSTTNWRSTAND
ncbi:hypothetical protein GCM10028808_47460 [Spirosoma migulaei]